MEKKKLPKWVWFVHDCIPVLVPFLGFLFVCFDVIYGCEVHNWSAGASAAIDWTEQLQRQPVEVQFPFLFSFSMGFGVLNSLFQLLWVFICGGIFKLKQILHNKKAPR